MTRTHLALVAALVLSTLVPGRAHAQDPDRTVPIIAERPDLPRPTSAPIDLGTARERLERSRYSAPDRYVLANPRLTDLETRATIAEWVLWLGSGASIASLVAGVAVSFGEDDIVGGGVLLATGVVGFVTAIVVHATLRPRADDLQFALEF